MVDDTTEGRRCEVVINDEQQYSLWFVGRPVPPGWRTAGMTGSKEECLAFVDREWTDMRPLSLRKWLERGADEAVPAAGD